MAIDGILFSENSNRQHDISTSYPSVGKILSTGYIKNVSLSGFLKISDLIIDSDVDRSILNFNYNDTRTSEIYGKLILRNKSKATISTGEVILRPGATISMEGDHDFTIPSNSILRLNSGSTLTGLSNRKIIVQSNAELIIDNNATIDLLCDLVVESGGKLTILKMVKSEHIKKLLSCQILLN